MPARIFSGAGLADSPVCSRSRTTILGCTSIRYRRLGVPAETSAARSLGSAPDRDRLHRVKSRVRTHLRDRRTILRLQGHSHPSFERKAIAVGRDALTLAVGIDL